MQEIDTSNTYDNNEPYIFLSYVREREDLMVKVYDQLTNAGYRVWCDMGIIPADKWFPLILDKIEKSAHFIGIVTEKYFSSYYCGKEINAALAPYIDKYEHAEDPNSVPFPITMLFFDGITLDKIPPDYRAHLSQHQHCFFDSDDSFNEKNADFQKLLKVRNIAKCKIDFTTPSSQIISADNENIQSENYADILNTNRVPDARSHTFSTTEKSELCKIMMNMASSALADRAHNLSQFFPTITYK